MMNRNITNLGMVQLIWIPRCKLISICWGLRTRFLSDRRPAIFSGVLLCGVDEMIWHDALFPQVWASDNTDAIARLLYSMDHPISIQPFLWELMCQLHKSLDGPRMTPLELVVSVAMMGNLGYELDLTSLSDEEKTEIANQVNLYKELVQSS